MLNPITLLKESKTARLGLMVFMAMGVAGVALWPTVQEATLETPLATTPPAESSEESSEEETADTEATEPASTGSGSSTTAASARAAQLEGLIQAALLRGVPVVVPVAAPPGTALYQAPLPQVAAVEKVGSNVPFFLQEVGAMPGAAMMNVDLNKQKDEDDALFAAGVPNNSENEATSIGALAGLGVLAALPLLFGSGDGNNSEAQTSPGDDPPTPVPTPALLPGLIGLAIKARQQARQGA